MIGEEKVSGGCDDCYAGMEVCIYVDKVQVNLTLDTSSRGKDSRGDIAIQGLYMTINGKMVLRKEHWRNCQRRLFEVDYHIKSDVISYFLKEPKPTDLRTSSLSIRGQAFRKTSLCHKKSMNVNSVRLTDESHDQKCQWLVHEDIRLSPKNHPCMLSSSPQGTMST